MSELLYSDKPNPDAALKVQFFSKLVKNDFRSQLTGEDVLDTVDYVRIETPGDTLNVPERPVLEDDKKRFGLQWSAYKARVGTVEGVVGTPLSKWTRLREDQIAELTAMKFTTIEAIALASDMHIQGIGMIAGQSAFSFRDEAKAFLNKLDAESKLSEADLKVQAMKDELAAKEASLLAQMEAMQQQMTEMSQAFNAQQKDVQIETPKRGRPFKEAVNA